MDALRKLFCDLTASERALLAAGAALLLMLALHVAAKEHPPCCQPAPHAFLLPRA
ncbi:MAG TPA: hypothetical protein VMS87_04120 [Roseiarcus sp.]|nr:hypothetical protein [Roseiarcus sp.]